MSEPTPSARLAELGLTLPAPPAPLAAYRPAVRDGDLVWTSGQLPLVSSRPMAHGKVGTEVDEDTAYACTRQATLNALAAIAAEADGLDSIVRVLRLAVYVASDPLFARQPAVADGGSDLIGEIFGSAGAHARSAVGVLVLPLDSPVEVEVVARVATGDRR